MAEWQGLGYTFNYNARMATVFIFQSNSETIGRSKALVLILFEPAHDKTYNKTCPTSEDSDHPVHLRSMIRVFADRMCIPQPPDYPKRDKR